MNMFLMIIFTLSAFLAVGGALSVAFAKNLIHACVYLLFSLIGVAGLYLTLGAEFVAATQLVVYVGGVVVLLLFAIMLTGGSNLHHVTSRFGLESTPLMGNLRTYIMGIVTALLLIAVLCNVLQGSISASAVVESKFSSTVEQIGVKLVTDHILAFEISSVLLLGALVGAAIIARPYRSSETEN
ncbi:MAG: NADH-quinone oxidoreductase subunit J [Bdellovibrio sp.]|nr:NADH-quinone oxidoreductase subunit J [Bdellovibrio sp.]